MENKTVKPWVGENYESPAILPYKTLIVAESNYTETEEQFNKDLVNSCVSDDFTGSDRKGFGRFATKLRRTIFGRDSNMSPAEFWPHVAFYNFVQYRVGDAARIRPTPEMWRNSAPVFFKVVAQLRPERVLIAGLKNWGNLLQAVPHEKLSKNQALLKIDDQKILAGCIQHPSSALKYAEWHPVAHELLLKKP